MPQCVYRRYCDDGPAAVPLRSAARRGPERRLPAASCDEQPATTASAATDTAHRRCRTPLTTASTARGAPRFPTPLRHPELRIGIGATYVATTREVDRPKGGGYPRPRSVYYTH